MAAARKCFNAVEIDDDHEILDENKQVIQNKIFAKMQQMNDQFFDLTEDKINNIQEILEFEYDEESSDDDVRDDSETFQGTYENDGDFVQNNDTAGANVSALNQESNSENSDGEEASFQWIYSEIDRFHMPLTSKIDAEVFARAQENGGDPNQNESNGVNFVSSRDEESSQVLYEKNDNSHRNNGNGVDVASNPDQVSYDSSGQSTVNDTCSNLIRIKNEDTNANDSNSSGTIPMFSPPTSTSVFSSQVPNYFARLDPTLYGLINQREKNKSNGSQSQVSSVQAVLNRVPSIFPDHFTHVC